MCQIHVLFLSEAGVKPVPTCWSKTDMAKLNVGDVRVYKANSTGAKELKQYKGKIKWVAKEKMTKW